MGWVEDPFSTSIGSYLKFLEASENARAQPTANHLYLTHQCRQQLLRMWEHTMHGDFVPAMVRTYQKVQAPVFLYTQNPKYLLIC